MRSIPKCEQIIENNVCKMTRTVTLGLVRKIQIETEIQQNPSLTFYSPNAHVCDHWNHGLPSNGVLTTQLFLSVFIVSSNLSKFDL
jgi:hypothetical protein